MVATNKQFLPKRLALVSMVYPFTAKYTFDGAHDGSQIKGNRPVGQIISIIINLAWNRQVVTPVDLGPASDARMNAVHALFGPQRDQIELIEKRGPRSDKTHIAF